MPVTKAKQATGYCTKLSFDELVESSLRDHCRPCPGAFFLLAASAAPVNRVELRPLQGVEAFRAVMEHIVRLDSGDKTSNAAELGYVAQLLGLMPVYELAYPREYDCLPDVWESVKGHLDRSDTVRGGSKAPAGHALVH